MEALRILTRSTSQQVPQLVNGMFQLQTSKSSGTPGPPLRKHQDEISWGGKAALELCVLLCLGAAADANHIDAWLRHPCSALAAALSVHPSLHSEDLCGFVDPVLSAPTVPGVLEPFIKQPSLSVQYEL